MPVIVNLQNQELEIKRQTVGTLEANARKQDLIALFKKKTPDDRKSKTLKLINISTTLLLISKQYTQCTILFK